MCLLQHLVYEHLEQYFYCQGRRVVFSSCGFNASVSVDILSEKVPLSHFFPGHSDTNTLAVYKCTSKIQSIKETEASIFTLKFVIDAGWKNEC